MTTRSGREYKEMDPEGTARGRGEEDATMRDGRHSAATRGSGGNTETESGMVDMLRLLLVQQEDERRRREERERIQFEQRQRWEETQ